MLGAGVVEEKRSKRIYPRLSQYNLPDIKNIKEAFECGIAVAEGINYTVAHILEQIKQGLVMGIPFSQLITHDMDKFVPFMMMTYSNYFFYDNNLQKNKVKFALAQDDKEKNKLSKKIDYYNKKKLDWAEAFEYAHIRHQKNNDHHIEYWEKDSTDVLHIPDDKVKKIMPDWASVKTVKNKHIKDYNLNKEMHAFHEQMILTKYGNLFDEETKASFEKYLNEYFPLQIEIVPQTAKKDTFSSQEGLMQLLGNTALVMNVNNR